VKCDFNLCIYNFECHCMLDDVSINPTGTCNECTPINIPEDELDHLKFEQLKQLGKSGPRRIQ